MRDWDDFLPTYMRGPESTAGMTGDAFLKLLASQSRKGFTATFSRICTKHNLGKFLTADELKQLYAAALFATLCSIAFNGLGGCAGNIKPHLELHRVFLERDFMEARADLFDTPGWRTLSPQLKQTAARIFLRALVDDRNLA